MIDQNKYYRHAREASLQIGENPGLLSLQTIASKSQNILDVGCGEGSRLNLLLGNKDGAGIDINRFAINKAKKQYPKHKFSLYDGVKIPFGENSFDLVYSAFVLEHTEDPQHFVEELVRVTGKNGTTVIICPNFGAPNRRSPVSTAKPVLKLFSGFIKDFLPSLQKLNFKKVTPKKVFKNIDDDTTQEPYLLDLLKFVSTNINISVQSSSSLWEVDDNAKSLHQRIFMFLGKRDIFPFRYWGPQLFIVMKKLS